MVPRNTIEGLGAYVATVGLPSMLFGNIAKLSMSDVDWYLVGSVVAAKLILVVLGSAFAWLTTRREDGTGFAFTLGGVTTLLSTMSDDMGIGLPVFSAFLADDDRDSAFMHLIILSAVQSAVLNPIAFVLLGLGRAVAREQEQRDREDARSRSGVALKEPATGARVSPGRRRTVTEASVWPILLDVLKGFRKNMMVLAVVAGGAYNQLTQRAPLPWWLGIPVNIAGRTRRAHL